MAGGIYLLDIDLHPIISYIMGLEESKPIEKTKSFSRSMSSLSEKGFQGEIITLSSDLASLVSLTSTTDVFDYQIFRRLPFKEHYSPLPLCNIISYRSNSIFICYDCSINQEAFLCQNCFSNGDHDSHRFSVYTDNAGYTQTFCRCGDSNFMKKKTICKEHKEASKIGAILVDKKEAVKFNAYFTAIIKTYLTASNNGDYLLQSMLNYLLTLTKDNLYYSKMLIEFLLNCFNPLDPQKTMLEFLLQKDRNQTQRLFRNLNFVDEYKHAFLTEMIKVINSGCYCSAQLIEFIVHFAGSAQVLNELARDKELILQNTSFFQVVVKLKAETTDIWKCAVKKNMISRFVSDNKIMKTLLDKLKPFPELMLDILKQLLEIDVGQSNRYVLACLMVVAPQFFIKKSKPRNNFDKTLEKLFADYYKQIFNKMNTHQRGNIVYCELLLLLPFFSFGEKYVSKFWDQFERRINILEGYKERDFIINGSWHYLDILAKLAQEFVKWEHTVMKKANQFQFTAYLQEKQLIKRLLIENFDLRQKIMKDNLLPIVDSYTQKQRDLAKDIIKKELRFNPYKEKYYYVGKVLENNFFNYDKLRVDGNFPLTDWQSFVGQRFFHPKVYSCIIKLISTAQRALKDDLEMVKTVSNLGIFLSLLNRKEKHELKATTRKFIKEIPDVHESTYYLLADIRNRFQLDVDDMEQEGLKGRKKRKLDIIAEIRDKKFEEIREKQRKNREKWLKLAQKGFGGGEEKEVDDDICYVCKEKEEKNNRFVIPCHFTRNSVVSTLLHSEVTDLDINVCLHQMHEECFNKLKKRNQCPVCKFQANCFIPMKPLPDESYTKTWLRKFQQITTTINLETGKNFSSDWATIFLTYLVYTRSFKVLLQSSEKQQRQRNMVDELIMMHYRSQLQKWPDLTKQALGKAEKTVKGQIRRESNIKKVVKSLVLDLVLEEITEAQFKNEKRIHKKFRELITAIGKENSQKISDCFAWAQNNQGVDKTFDEGIEGDEDHDLFKIKKLPTSALEFMRETSIKCPMCDKYQPRAWKCLYCEKMSCQNCMRVRNHCEFDHKGSVIILFLNDALYELWADNKCVESGSLYRNQYLEGWKRSMKPQGWKANVENIYTFFDKILHSESVEKRRPTDDDSDDDRNNDDRWGNQDNEDEDNEDYDEDDQ